MARGDVGATWTARVIQVIESELTLRGDGTESNPYRRVTEFFTLDGEKLAERDHWSEAQNPSKAGQE